MPLSTAVAHRHLLPVAEGPNPTHMLRNNTRGDPHRKPMDIVEHYLRLIQIGTASIVIPKVRRVGGGGRRNRPNGERRLITDRPAPWTGRGRAPASAAAAAPAGGGR